VSRIIAGTVGGRRIATPRGTATRPTTDRVREALFSVIASWAGRGQDSPGESLRGLAFADLYAGSGAVGLEAASRGASPVVLVESDRRVLELVRANARSLEVPVEIRGMPVEQLARRQADLSFSVAFVDPPYAMSSAMLGEVLADLDEHGWLAARCLIVAERSRRSPDLAMPAGFTSWTKAYGETLLHFGSRGGG
jgi:16S rRNA (guanine966-N2)-methyltransferase